MIKLAINGFGRIGRIALRTIWMHYKDQVEVVAVNTSGSMDIEGWAHLLEYDSVHGRFERNIKTQMSKVKNEEEIGALEIGGKMIPFLAQREPALIPWKDYGVQVVLESTGHFTDKAGAGAHLKAGAEKVVVSAEAKELPDFVIGVNDDEYQGQLIVGNASCTTNCIAPLVKIIRDKFGLQKAVMSTIHAYTSTQELTDDSNEDLRRARAAAINIIPTTTGAAKTTVEVIPALQGLFDGLSYRVPVACGSVAEIVFVTTKRTTVEEVNQTLFSAAQNQFKGIVEYSEKPLVSSDIVGNCHSSIVDGKLTQVIDGDLVKVVAWYDNEWGYSCRLVELAIKIGGGK
jgi:glyceraldehyde 3-phosphate dehydrogenase